MPVEDNKAVVRRYIELGWSRGDSGVLKECVAPDYHRYQPGLPFPIESENDLEQLIGMYRAGLSDLEVVIDRMVAEGDYVATQVIVRGTHDGELAGVPATGTRVEITASDVFRMADGQIVESWHNVDDLGLLRQVGVLPTT